MNENLYPSVTITASLIVIVPIRTNKLKF